MKIEFIFDDIFMSIKDKKIKDKKLLSIVNTLKNLRNSFNKGVKIKILDVFNKEYKKFVAYVTIINQEYFKIYINEKYEKYTVHLPYVLLHELLHIVLKHFFKENIYNSHFMNIIKDIEVNMYIDLLTNYIPEIHLMYIKNISELLEKEDRIILGFFAYIISLNLIEDLGGLEKFVNEHLFFLSDEQKAHWIEFQNKRKKGIVSYEDILEEAKYWIEASDVLSTARISEEFNSFDNIKYKSGQVKSMNTMPKKILSKYNRILNDLKQYIARSKSMKKNKQVALVRSILPMHLSRKNYVELSSNMEPVFYENYIMKDTYSRKSLYIYIDVSGSMFNYIGYAMELMKFFADMNPKIFLFSMYVQEYDLKKFIEGDYETSFGTYIDPVLNHIAENRLENAIILTDMQWTIKSKKTLKNLKKANSKIHFIAINTNIGRKIIRIFKMFAKSCLGKYYEINIREGD